MKLGKAKELSEIYARHPLNNMTPDEKVAHKLGIEAINYILRLRAFSLVHRQARLPSEDTEPDFNLSEDEKKHVRESPLGKV